MLKGSVWKFGDNIDTDIIIPARYLALTDPVLGSTLHGAPRPRLRERRCQKGDIIVAGTNFGCGSSREHAPLAIVALGIPVVIAKSFARIFYGTPLIRALRCWKRTSTIRVRGRGDLLKSICRRALSRPGASK